MLSVASAFTPTRPLTTRAVRPAVRAEPKMALDVATADSVVSTVEALNNLVVASSANDFGGLAAPIAGLGFLTGLIVLLAPPISE